MEKLEKLKKEATIQRKKLNKLVSAIAREESEIGMPELNKKYLGKCFKTKDRYSYGKSWYIYSIVDEIQHLNSYKGRSFCTTPDGKREFNFQYMGYLNHLGKEIKKEEYLQQLEMTTIFLSEKFK